MYSIQWHEYITVYLSILLMNSNMVSFAIIVHDTHMCISKRSWQQIKNSYPLDTSVLFVSNCFSIPFSTSLSWQSSNHLHLTQFNDSYNSNSSYRIIYAYHVPGCILEVLCIIYLNLVITQQPYTDGYYDPHFINKETNSERFI